MGYETKEEFFDRHEVDPPNGYRTDTFKEFVWWVHERMQIYRRRFEEGQDSPWTEDPILKEYRFTNPYRELDRETIYLRNNIIGEGSLPDVMLNCLFFRIFNKKETHQAVGFLEVDEWDPWEVCGSVQYERKKGLKPFNSAYMITGVGFGLTEEDAREGQISTFDPKDKVQNYIIGVFHNQFMAERGRYTRHVTKPTSMEECWEQLQSLSGVSGFIAYEIVCDLQYDIRVPWSQNDFVNPGPGARRGIQRLLDLGEIDQSKHRDIDYTDHIEEIQATQGEWLPDDFYAWEGRELSLRAIEHSCCEFDKAIRAERGEGRHAKFDPETEWLDPDKGYRKGEDEDEEEEDPEEQGMDRFL